MPRSEFHEAWDRCAVKLPKNQAILADPNASAEKKHEAVRAIKRDEKWLNDIPANCGDKYGRQRWKRHIVGAIFNKWHWEPLPRVQEIIKDPDISKIIDSHPDTPYNWKSTSGYRRNLKQIPRKLITAVTEAIEASPITFKRAKRGRPKNI